MFPSFFSRRKYTPRTSVRRSILKDFERQHRRVLDAAHRSHFFSTEMTTEGSGNIGTGDGTFTERQDERGPAALTHAPHYPKLASESKIWDCVREIRRCIRAGFI